MNEGNEMKWVDVCLDLETFATGPEAAIIQVGALVFGGKGQMGPEGPKADEEPLGGTFCEDVEWRQPGRKVDAETLAWWFELREKGTRVPYGEAPLVEVLGRFARWLDEVALSRTRQDLPAVRVWAKGPSFDCAILAHAFRAHGMRVPWHYSAERCVRTVVDLAGGIGWRTAPVHEALADAMQEAQEVRAAVRHIWKTEVVF